MPDNPMCSPNEFMIHETTVTKKKIKEKASYMFYIPASTFKRRIKHPPGHAPCRHDLNIDRRKSNQWVPAVFFCALEDGSQFFWLYPQGKERNAECKKEKSESNLAGKKSRWRLRKMSTRGFTGHGGAGV